MDTGKYIQKFKKTQKNLSEDQVLADEVWKYFGKRLAFPRIMKEIKTKGKVFVRETMIEIQKGNARDRLALFLWKIKNCKVELKEERKLEHLLVCTPDTPIEERFLVFSEKNEQ